MLKKTILLVMAAPVLFTGCANRSDESSNAGQGSRSDRISDHALTEEELQKLLEEEERLSDRSHGKSSVVIHRVTDPNELEKVRKLGEGRTFSLLDGLLRGDKNSFARLKANLQSPDVDKQNRALWELKPFFWEKPFPADATIQQLVTKLSHDGPNKTEALEALLTVDPPVATRRYFDLLKSGKATIEEEDVILELAERLPPSNALTAELMELAGSAADPEIARKSPRRATLVAFALAKHSENAAAAQLKAITAAMLELIQDPSLEEYAVQRLLQSLARNPRADMEPVFRKWKDREFGPEHALMGWAKLKGKAAQAEVLAAIQDPNYGYRYVQAIGPAWKGDEAGAIKTYLLAFKKTKDEYDHRLMLHEVYKAGGSKLCKAVIDAMDDTKTKKMLEDGFHLAYDPIDDSHPLGMQARRLKEMGLLRQPLTAADLQKMREDQLEYGSWEFDGQLLDHMSCVTMFDAETGSFPNPYDKLLLGSLVPITGGKLDGLECYMSWDEEQEDDPNEKVWVIFQGRGYQFEPEYFGDWYDLGAVEAVMEMVLEDAGLPERFVSWNTGDQMAGYVFAEPSRAREIIDLLELEAHIE